MTRVLLIDDDDKLGRLLGDFLARYEIELDSATHPSAGLEKIRKDPPDLVILDVMLPDYDGFEACRRIRRASDLPVLMLTARGEVTDRIVGLEIGADDYMPKPFEPRELVARIQNILRRWHRRPAPGGALEFAGIRIEPDTRSVYRDGEPVALTTMEYELLKLLAENHGKTLDRDRILGHLRGIDTQLFSRSVDILVSRLRSKLGDSARNARFVKTVRGIGYVFAAEQPPAKPATGG